VTTRDDWINMDAPIHWGTPVDRSEIKPPYPMWCPACERVHPDDARPRAEKRRAEQEVPDA
jgi:hypothetical protein